MSILSTNDFWAAQRQILNLSKTGSRATVASAWFSVFDQAGNVGAGTLAGADTAAGVVPTDATAGCPRINDFLPGATGYLDMVAYGSSVACRMAVCDLLFKAGAYAFNANTSLASQPSYASRCQLAGSWAASRVFRAGDRVVNNANLYICTTGGTSAGSGGPTTTGTGIADNTCTWDYLSGGIDYGGTQIWIETVTAFTGNLSVAVTYTNQDGTTARSTGTVATGVAPTVGRLIQLPLQAGDSGVQKIESVVATVSTAGTFNVLVAKPLWMNRVGLINTGGIDGPDRTGRPLVFSDSALVLVLATDQASSGVPDLNVGITSL